MFRTIRTLLRTAAKILGLSAAALPLLAAAPVKQSYSFTADVVISPCGFPITISGTVTGTATYFFDSAGNLTRIHFQQTEQDVFSANGKSLQGLPYTASQEVLFDATGNFTHIYGSGVMAKVQLPDGSVFMSAGRVDALNQLFVLTPDEGHSGNLEALCAALAP